MKFSVVIPLYNKEKEIKDTIKSVLNQTYKPDEVIVVDDGSTDDSAKIVETFKEVKLIKQKNSGVSSARNRGIKEVKNEYICFIDADDLWEREFLEEIRELIIKFPNNFFYSTSHKMIDENGKVIYPKIPFENFQGEIDFFDYFKDYYGILNSSSVCIKKSVNLFFPEGEKKGEDICMWIELGLKSKLAFSSKHLSIYKLNASNRSGIIHKDVVIPCQLKWIYKNKNRVTKKIKDLVYKNLLITIYGGYAMNGDYKSIKGIIEFMKEKKDNFRFLLYPAFFMPVKLLDIIRKIRRWKK